jgi:endonuclease V-like protein UPF0215 family
LRPVCYRPGMGRTFSHLVGFDDGPFPRSHRGDVPVVGAVFAGPRLHGVLTARVRKDGANATRVLAETVEGSRFAGHLQAVLLQGIALGGFNVVDVQALHRRLGLPVLVVMRRPPDFAKIREALRSRVPGGAAKWARIQRAGPVERAGRVYVQRAGISLEAARALLAAATLEGDLPEPLRTAHLIAGALVTGHSRGRA